jgi:hypothetical protein
MAITITIFMKTIVIDQNAHDILNWAKEKAQGDGIESPSHSDAIRWLKNQTEEVGEKNENRK